MPILASLSERLTGGLAVLRDGRIERIDRVTTSGLSVAGGRLYRLVAANQYEASELFVYDGDGVRTYTRLDDVGDPHDVLASDDGDVLCVSSHRDAILRVYPGGETSVYEGGTAFDERHVNCITRSDGVLYATSFGRAQGYRGWKDAPIDSGALFEVDTGRVVAGGLAQPHTPRYFDGSWFVCESARGTLIRLGDDGERRDVLIGGFTRGLCATDRAIFVGVSQRPASDDEDGAELVELDRRTLAERARYPVPATMVFDIVEVDDALLAGVERGFAETRSVLTLRQQGLFDEIGSEPRRIWAVGVLLRRKDRRCALAGELPSEMRAGEAVMREIAVTNRGGAIFVSAAPALIALRYYWRSVREHGSVDVVPSDYFTDLMHPLPPGETARTRMLIAAPRRAGRYELAVTLTQGRVDFDGDDTCALHAGVRVVPRNLVCLEPSRRYGLAASDSDVDALLGDGWHEPDERGAWTAATPAYLAFAVPLDGRYCVAVDVAAYRPSSAQPVLRVEIDGVEVAVQIAPQTVGSVVTEPITLRAGLANLLSLTVPTMWTPADDGLPDSRSLGIFVAGITLAHVD